MSIFEPSKFTQENRTWLIPATVITGGLLVAIVLAFRPSMMFVVLLVAVFGGLAVWQNEGFGWLALIVGGLIVPTALGTGTESELNAAFLLVPTMFGIWVVKGLLDGQLRLMRSPVMSALIFFIIATTLSLAASSILWNPFAELAPFNTRVAGWGLYVFSALALITIAHQIHDVRWLKVFTYTFILIAGVQAVSRIFPVLAPVAQFYPNGATGSLFWVWLIVMAGSQAIFNRSLDWRWRFVLIVLTLATIYAQVHPDARHWASGWIPVISAAICLLFLVNPRVGVIVGLIAGGYWLTTLFQTDYSTRPTVDLLQLTSGQTLESLVLFSDDQYSFISRIAAWQIILQKIFMSNPITGVGPANYYFYTPLYPIFGWYVKFNSHNQFVDILAQTGILGMAGFLWFYAAITRVGWQLRSVIQDDFERAYVLGCLAGLGGTFVACVLGDWLLPFAYNVGVAGFRSSIIAWVFLGGLLVIKRLRDAQQPELPNTNFDF